MKKIRILLAAALCASLSGCGAFTAIENAGAVAAGTSVSSQVAGAAVSGANVVEGAATTYLSLSLCGSAGATAACRTQTASVALNNAMQPGIVAKNQVYGLIKTANGGPIPVASYNTLVAANTSLQAVETQYGIK